MALGIPFNDGQISQALIAVAAHGGNIGAAQKALGDDPEGFSISYDTLRQWVNYTHAERYSELRDRFRDQIEKQLADKQTDAAALGTQVVQQALEKAQERLENGKDQDPAKTAANTASAVDKMMRVSLTLQNRPTSIKETRGLPEMLRSLIARGVFLPAEPTVDAITEGDDHEDPGSSADE